MEEEEVDEFGIPIKPKEDEFGVPIRTEDEYGIPVKASAVETLAAGVGAFNRGMSQVVTAPLKVLGALEETVGGVGYLSQAGQAIDEFVEEYNPRYENVNETYQSVGEGLGQAAGMIASAGTSGAAGLAQTTTKGVLPALGKSLATKPAVLGGSMTAAPEWEAAKEAGLSDEEAFEVLVKNYLVGQTEQIPIQNLLGRLNRITGNIVLNTVKAMGIQGIEEGVQEGVQTYLTNQIAKEDYDPDRDPLFQVLESAKVGGIVGLILPGAISIAKSSSGEKRVKLERKLGELQVNQAIAESDTGDPQINAEIDASAQVDPVDKEVLKEVRVAEAVQEEQKEIETKEKLQLEKSNIMPNAENKESKSKSAETLIRINSVDDFIEPTEEEIGDNRTFNLIRGNVYVGEDLGQSKNIQNPFDISQAFPSMFGNLPDRQVKSLEKQISNYKNEIKTATFRRRRFIEGQLGALEGELREVNKKRSEKSTTEQENRDLGLIWLTSQKKTAKYYAEPLTNIPQGLLGERPAPSVNYDVVSLTPSKILDLSKITNEIGGLWGEGTDRGVIEEALGVNLDDLPDPPEYAFELFRDRSAKKVVQSLIAKGYDLVRINENGQDNFIILDKSIINKPNEKKSDKKGVKTEENKEKEQYTAPSSTPEYKIAVAKVADLQKKFADLPIEENADELLFELRQARQELQKIAGKPKDTRKKTDTQKQIEDATGVTKPEKSVQMTPQDALETQIRILDRGIKLGRDLTQEQVVSRIKDAAKEVNLSPKQIQSLASRASKVSLSEKSIEKFNTYVQRVVADADYSDKVSTAEKLKRTIKKRVKNLTIKEQKSLKNFLQISPEDVNVQEYVGVADDVTKSFRPVTSEGHKPLKLKDVDDYVAKEISYQYAKDFPEGDKDLAVDEKLSLIQDRRAEERREAQNERLRRKLEKDFTPEQVNGFLEVLSNETEVDREITDLNKREQIRQVFKALGEQRQKDLPVIEDLTQKEQDILKTLKEANLSLLTADQLKLYVQLSDRITENEDFGKAGFIPVILKAQEEFKNLEKLDLNILGVTDFELEVSANLPAVFRAITGLPDIAAKFQLYLGIKGLNETATASVKASEDFVHKLNTMNDQFTKLYGAKRNGFTDESIFRQGIYAELIKHDALSDPSEFLQRNKEAITATIGTYREMEKTQDAEVYQHLFKPFERAQTIEEVSDIMQRVDPAGKRVVDFIVDYMKPYGQRVKESNVLYYNKPNQDVNNYAGETVWYRISEVGQEQSTSESDLQDIDGIGNYKLRPANPKQDRSQMIFKRVIPKGKVLDFNIHHRVNKQIQRVHFKTEAAPYLLQVREMIKKTDRMKNLLGGGAKGDQLYGKIFNPNTGTYFRFENNLLNKGDIPTKFDRTTRNLMNTLRKWGYNLRLGGLTQWVKQPTVLVNTMIQVGDPSVVTESISEIYSNPQGYKEFVKGETVSMRGEQKSLFNIGDSYVASLNKDLKNEINQAVSKDFSKWTERVFENELTGIGALVKSDRFAANPSYVSFYRKHLKDRGIKYLGFAEENKLRDTPERREARAVAKQMLDDLQVVSNPAEMTARIQSDRDYKTQVAKAILFPFGGFSTSTKQRLVSDWRAVATGNSKQRSYAIKDITATLAEQAVFQTINQFALGYAWHFLGEFYEWAFNLPEDDDEEKMDKWWQRTWTGVILDNIPLILTNPGEEILIDIVNYTGYEFYKQRTGEDITYKQYGKEVGLPLAKFERPNQSTLSEVLDWLGPIAAPIQNTISAAQTTSEIFNEDLSPEQRRFVTWVAAMQWANLTGAWPSDLTSGTSRELREQKKMDKANTGSATVSEDLPDAPLEAVPDIPALPEIPVLPEL